MKVEIGSLGWELEELEQAALLTVKEEEEAAAAGQGGLPVVSPPEGPDTDLPEEGCAGPKPLIEELEGESTEDSSELETSSGSESDSDCTHNSTASEDKTETHT